MSKTSLTRELRTMEKDQLIEIILQAYSAGKETKEYFDFFVDPNPEGMYKKYSELIVKEFSRVKRGHRTKARISVIKGIIKKFMSFEPGAEYVTELYIHAISHALETEKNIYFTETLSNGIKKLTTEAFTYSDRHGTARHFLNGIENVVKAEKGTKYFRQMIRDCVADRLNGAENVSK